jgi:hypothetical protein
MCTRWCLHIRCDFSFIQSKKGVRWEKSFMIGSFELWYLGCEKFTGLTARRWCHEHYKQACRCVHVCSVFYSPKLKDLRVFSNASSHTYSMFCFDFLFFFF